MGGLLSNWFGSSTVRGRELRETREAWSGIEVAWGRSPFASETVSSLAFACWNDIINQIDRAPALPILAAIHSVIAQLLAQEDVLAVEPIWEVIDRDVSAAVDFRKMMARRRRWVLEYDRVYRTWSQLLVGAFVPFVNELPEICFRDWDDAGAFEVPLIDVLDRPMRAVERLYDATYSKEGAELDLFATARRRVLTNCIIASGLRPDADPEALLGRLKRPSTHSGKTGAEIADLYLSGTPFRELMDFPIPFEVPAESRFEHCHIVGGTGHGKTQLMQRMIYADLVAAKEDGRSVVVIDSQGDLIGKLSRLALFDPSEPGSLADRLVLIDPSDVEYPPSLNLFDTKLARLAEYRIADKERVLNGVVELYESFFGDLLGAELTQKQGVIFRYLARLMLQIEGAMIHTLMQLMEDGRPFRPYMEALDGAARHFFETEFFDASFSATKKQILKRLWGVLSTPSFERMFAQKTNKLDLFQALGDGKIILVSTAKDLLKSDGSALLGRFFIALLKQAALERSTLPEHARTPVMVYVDEAQEYFDDSIETILNQARKYRLSLTIAHQALDQLSPRLRSVLASNTSMKCAGGVSAKDARALADDMQTTPDFIDSMRRKGGRTEFAVSVKHVTGQAIRLSVPLGFLERQPLLTEEAFEALLDANRARYCGTLEDAQQAMEAARFSAPLPAEPEPSREPVAQRFEERVQPAAPIEPEELAPVPPPLPPRPRQAEEREPGKGGKQHRYVQHLIKQLAEERGFRAVIEEAVDDGSVDVGLHRGDLSIACEISVTSTAEYEAQNLAKCLRAGFAQIWAVAPDQKRRRVIEAPPPARRGEEGFGKILFLSPEDLPLHLDHYAAPEPEEKIVRGYKVKVTRKSVSPEEAAEKRATIARILAQSLRARDP